MWLLVSIYIIIILEKFLNGFCYFDCIIKIFCLNFYFCGLYVYFILYYFYNFLVGWFNFFVCYVMYLVIVVLKSFFGEW